jgi:hypothetical protein
MWIPSVLLNPSFAWNERDATHVEMDMTLQGQHSRCELSLDEQGRLCSVSMLRWGDPKGRGFSALPFGAIVEEERTFGGYTIPSKLRVGWYFGGDRFESEGKFFRCTIEEATCR